MTSDVRTLTCYHREFHPESSVESEICVLGLGLRPCDTCAIHINVKPSLFNHYFVFMKVSPVWAVGRMLVEHAIVGIEFEENSTINNKTADEQ